MNGQLLAAAPMEGLTTAVFRRLHHQYFGGTDLYYIPFITPTVEPKFTDRHLKELSPEVNAGIPVVPQLLSNRSADFIWAAKALQDLGYKEVNLNLGCPSGTVVAKGKGSGFLRDLYALERFLDEIFSAGITVPISIKTRLGWANTEEFGDILNLYKKYPLSFLSTFHKHCTKAPKDQRLCKLISFKSYKSGGKRNLMIFQQKHLWVTKLTNFSSVLLIIM